MNENSDAKQLFLGLLFIVGLYAAYKTVTAITLAIKIFLMGLVNISLIAIGILVIFFLYRYISEKNFGDTRKIRLANKLEQERQLTLEQTPDILHPEINSYYEDKMREIYSLSPKSRTDGFLDRTKQVFNIFRRKDR
jgi:hypothetical protein